MPTSERIAESCGLSEGPHWDVVNQCLYFADIIEKSIFKYTPDTGKVTKAKLEKHVSFIIPIEGRKNEFIISQANELVVISWDGESDKVSVLDKLGAVDSSSETCMLFTDAKCDSSGRLWAGVHHVVEEPEKPEPLGSLYSLDAKKQLREHVGQIQCSKGIAFNDETKKMFYVDTMKGTVDRFDFDITNGTICNRKDWFTLQNFNIAGMPDGMTIDADGNLWVAAVLAGRVLKIDGSKPETLLDTITLPTEQVTSVTFGGKNLDELYVTSGCVEFLGKKVLFPVDGATYRVKATGSKGLPAVNFRLND